MTTFHTINPAVEIALKKPITFEHGRAFYENPLAICEGDPSAPKIAVVKSPGGGAPAQNALATDETDQAKRLAPDGAGGTAWRLPFDGVTTEHDSGGNDYIQTADFASGIWHVDAKGYRNGGSAAICLGHCYIKNGVVSVQNTQCTALVSGTSNLDGAAFAMSGSGPTLRVTFTPTITGAPGAIAAAQLTAQRTA